MQKWFLFLVLAVLSYEALGLSYRNRRQAESSESNSEDDLEDRYGWNRPNWQGGWPRPGQGQRPGGGQNQLPGQGQDQNQLPGQGQGQNPTPTPNTSGPTTQSTAIRDCIRTCPVTSEYNPVCGTNGVTYNNPGRLGCAQACGVSVSLQRSSRCPDAVQAN